MFASDYPKSDGWPEQFGACSAEGAQLKRVQGKCAQDAQGMQGKRPEDAPGRRRIRVLVMMATYNAQRYVAEQIESIVLQRGVDVSLVISDDGSGDLTPLICEAYAHELENVTFRVNAANKGIERNFMDMVYSADAQAFDYFAFSDQDDVWLPNKIEHAIAAIEAAGGGPALYYSDVCNVDENLENPTRDFAKFAPLAQSLPTLLVCNWASGCTMVFDRKLCRLLQESPVSPTGRNHDGWVHLVALACAKTVPDLENAYILRRISGSNSVGVSVYQDSPAKRLASSLRTALLPCDHAAVNTARQLLESYENYMSEEDIRLVKAFSKLDSSMRRRLVMAASGRFFMPSALETLILRARMLLNRL